MASPNHIEIRSEAPPITEFIRLRAEQNWGQLDLASAQNSLDNSVLNLCLYIGHELIGMGRVIGDGRLYFLLVDIIIVEPYRSQGHGQTIVRGLLDEIKAHIKAMTPDITAGSEAYIALMSAQGKETFYEKLGFETRPNSKMGAGMSLTLRL